MLNCVFSAPVNNCRLRCGFTSLSPEVSSEKSSGWNNVAAMLSTSSKGFLSIADFRDSSSTPDMVSGAGTMSRTVSIHNPAETTAPTAGITKAILLTPCCLTAGTISNNTSTSTSI